YRGTSAGNETEPLNRGDPVLGGPEYSFLDRDVTPGRVYSYKIAAVDASGHETPVGVVQATAGGPTALSLRRPRPNPFDRSTELPFTLPRVSSVRLTISDVHGRRVRRIVSEALPAGYHMVGWDGIDDRGRRAATGIYLVTLEVEGAVIRS